MKCVTNIGKMILIPKTTINEKYNFIDTMYLEYKLRNY